MSEEDQVPETTPETTEESAPAPEPEPEPAPAAEEAAPAAEEKAAPACSGECPCKMFTKPFEDSKFFGELKPVFMWEPKIMVSLLAFCVFNVFFLLLLCYDFTVLGLVCWIAFFATLACVCVDIMRVVAFFQGKEEKSMFEGKTAKIEENIEPAFAYLDGFFDLVKDIVKAFIKVCINAILVKDVVFSLSMLGVFLVLIYLAGHMGITGMIYGAVLFCFIWFRLYKEQKENIDKLFAKAKEGVQQLIQKAKEAINKPKSQ